MKKILIALIVLLVMAIAATIYIYQWRKKNDITKEQLEQQEALSLEEFPLQAPPKRIYGLVADSFHVESFKVARNQNLASILLAQDVEYPVIYQLAEKSKEKFDVRRIRTGNPYTLFYSLDSLRTPLWFVYEIDKTDYVVMQLTDSLKIIRDKKPIETVRKHGTGIITSSLWNTINDNNLHPLLAMELSEIYAWTVDFFGIEKGDKFRVIYDEQYVDSISIGIDAIHAAHFNHKGREYYAFRYKEDSTWSYFDEAGNSLRKAFLKAPLKFSRISSRFSNNRFHPVLKINRPHHGVDYAAPSGTPVYAIGDGTVTHRAWDPKGGGNYIKIRHNSVYTSVYMHLQGFGKGIQKGRFVQQGQLIGYVGSTGLSTGPHLDFRMFRNGSAVDPLKIEAPPVNPIHEDNMIEYLEYTEHWLRELQQLKQYTSPPITTTTSAVVQ
jgi:murein DD-endopeptidase MepM/ murein hydrolase activator NlpD